MKIGFIGVGNTEISLDKVSRFEREMERNGETELTVEDYQEKFEAEMAAITSDEELINGLGDKENEFTSIT